MSADPWCSYLPQGGAVIKPWQASSDEVRWSPAAKQRLSRVPGFLRKMVKKRAESYVREQHEQVVTPEHMETLVQRRFGKKGPPGAAPGSRQGRLRPQGSSGTKA